MLETTDKRRVVVADDSRLMRRILSDALGRQGFDVVATAADGDEALAACRAHRPDAMTLDLHMPGMDGLGVLRALREGKAEPVPGRRGLRLLARPRRPRRRRPRRGRLRAGRQARLRRAAGDLHLRARPQGRRGSPQRPRPPSGRAAGRPRRPRAPSRSAAAAVAGKKLVVIACSTGGPKALGDLIPRLPSPLGAGTLIVQHMPAGFTASLATRLDTASPLIVREAAGGETLEPGVALLAPGGAHLRVDGDRHARLSDDAPVGGLKPRADFTIEDAAKLYGPRMVLVVLTGMGRDGLEGAKAVRAAGGRILVEAESTCTVYGMPRAVAEAGLADEILPLDELAAAIAREAGR